MIAHYETDASPAPDASADYVCVSERPGVSWYVECGGSYHGETVLCDAHQRETESAYPQGWHYYPGDTCKHGVYVGGCGPDLMCFRCELGDD